MGDGPMGLSPRVPVSNQVHPCHGAMVYMYNACFSERVSFESKNNYALYFVQGPRGSNFPQLCTAHLGGIDRDACYTSRCPSLLGPSVRLRTCSDNQRWSRGWENLCCRCSMSCLTTDRTHHLYSERSERNI